MQPVIFLIGFMGSGKTVVGKLLARQLRLPFVDTDAMVSRTDGKSVEAIFRHRREPLFRRLEARAVRQACSGPARVVATGGGAVLVPGNVRAMMRAGTVVWLKVPFKTAVRRIEREGAFRRPLAAGETPAARRQALHALFAARVPWYRKAAHLAVDADAPPARVTDRILKRIHPRPEEA